MDNLVPDLEEIFATLVLNLASFLEDQEEWSFIVASIQSCK